MRVVVVHGMISPGGELSDAEVLASTDASLGKVALEKAAAQKWRSEEGDEPGTTPQGHEVFITVHVGGAT